MLTSPPSELEISQVALAESASHILCLGLNHTTSNIALRERLAFDSCQLQPVMKPERHAGQIREDIQEWVGLSTCNRIELYAVTSRPDFGLLETYLEETQGYQKSEFSKAFYRLQDGEAIRHIFEVSAGLDSMVIGEPQILGQVTEAYALAHKQGTAGKILSRLFQAAIHAGKRAHSETTISHNPASIASIAANLVAGAVPDLSSARILVLGAGEMAELAVEAFRKRGVSSILVVNRTLSHAQKLATRWHGEAAALDRLGMLLPEVDIVIASTGAAQTLIHTAMVADTIQRRPDRPLVFMDIAFPRDVDPQVKELPSVYLYDLDTLSQHLESNLAQREAEIPKVRAILVEEQAAFEAYLTSLEVIPIIVEMRNLADSIRQDEIKRAMRRMPKLSPAMERQIDVMTKSIVNKILHNPTARLREEANHHNAADYTSIARDLFGLD